MGIAGHVQTRPPEYGSSISDWAKESFYNFLSYAGISVVSADDDWASVVNSNHWEILIPEALKDGKWEYDYDAISKVASRLREVPGLVRTERIWGDSTEVPELVRTERIWGDSTAVGDIAAEMLDEGVAVAKQQKCGFIVIDWW